MCVCVCVHVGLHVHALLYVPWMPDLLEPYPEAELQLNAESSPWAEGIHSSLSPMNTMATRIRAG